MFSRVCPPAGAPAQVFRTLALLGVLGPEFSRSVDVKWGLRVLFAVF